MAVKMCSHKEDLIVYGISFLYFAEILKKNFL